MKRTMQAAAVLATSLLLGCAAMQQQQAAAIVEEARAHLQSIMQSCMQRIESDRDLDPIRAKVEVVRTGYSGAPPAGMLSDQARATPVEKAAIAKWQSIREACAQEQIRYGVALSLPSNLEPVRTKLLLVGRETNQRTGLLIAALYDGRLTYAQFAAERMKNADQMMASLTGGPSGAASEPNLAALQEPAPTVREEISLQRQGEGYLVPVAVNGLPPMPFLLDTGADVVALPAEIVFTLLRTGTLRSIDFIGNTTLVMADGRELPSFKFKIRELRVGRHAMRDVVGSINPALTEPLLGGSFLSRFASWSIDNQRHKLVLSQ